MGFGEIATLAGVLLSAVTVVATQLWAARNGRYNDIKDLRERVASLERVLLITKEENIRLKDENLDLYRRLRLAGDIASVPPLAH